MMNRIIILSVFACFVLYDLITWTPNKANTKPAQSSIADTSNLFTFSNSMDIRRIFIADSMIHDSALLINTALYDLTTGELSLAGDRKTPGTGRRAFMLYNGQILLSRGLNMQHTILSGTEPKGGITPDRKKMRNLSGL